MNLDLEDLLTGWECPTGEISARVVRGDEGEELIQLRVDLGMLQMVLDGRPDGTIYHGMPTVVDFIKHETRFGRVLGGEHWAALDREMTQLNYRRLALAAVAEDCLRVQREEEARRFLVRVLKDIELCQTGIDLLVVGRGSAGSHKSLIPTLIFNKARLTCQLCVIDGDFESAVDVSEKGADELYEHLSEAGYSDDGDDDPADNIGVAYLGELSRQLRVQHDVDMTLRERLEAAISADDFEAAAELHAELDRREKGRASGFDALDEDGDNSDISE